MFGNVFSQVDFASTLQSFSLDPLNGLLFPLLRPIAKLFEVYKCKSLKITYASQTGTAAVGALYTCIQYDPDTTLVPSTPREFMNYDTNNRETIWAPASTITLSPKTSNQMGFNGGWRYVGRGSNNQLDSKKLTTLGVLHVATTDYTSPGTTLGDLMIEYTFEFSSQLPPNPMVDYEWAEFHALGDTEYPLTTLSMDFGSTIDVRRLSDHALRFATPGEYYLTVWCVGAGLTTGNVTWTATGEGHQNSDFSMVNAGGTSLFTSYRIIVNSVMYFTIVSTATTLAAIHFVMTAFPYYAHAEQEEHVDRGDAEAITYSNALAYAAAHPADTTDEFDHCQ